MNTHSLRKKLRYHNDRAYREKRKRVSREYYWTKKGMRPPKGRVIMSNREIRNVSRARLVRSYKSTRERLESSLSYGQLAQVLGVSRPTIYSWVAKGVLPTPTHEANVRGAAVPVFLLSQVLEIAKQQRKSK